MTIDTAALRELCEKATPGKWAAEKRQVYAKDLPPDFELREPAYIADANVIDDAAFIAAARTALPDALDEIDRLRRLVSMAESGQGPDGHGSELSMQTATDEATEHLKELLPVKYRSRGSVEGRIDTISVHSKSKFTLYEGRTSRAIACYFDYDDRIEMVKNALRQKVVVSGDLLANARGETLRIKVQDIILVPPPRRVLSIRDLAGIDPDFTGGLTSDEYVRRLRSA